MDEMIIVEVEYVCMHREDAKTVSFTHIKVEEETISLAYSPFSPCETEDTDWTLKNLSHKCAKVAEILEL